LRASLISARGFMVMPPKMNYDVAIRAADHRHDRAPAIFTRAKSDRALAENKHQMRSAQKRTVDDIVDQWIEGTFNHFGYSQVQVPLLALWRAHREPASLHRNLKGRGYSVSQS
jgi:hypothetical protein